MVAVRLLSDYLMAISRFAFGLPSGCLLTVAVIRLPDLRRGLDDTALAVARGQPVDLRKRFELLRQITGAT